MSSRSQHRENFAEDFLAEATEIIAKLDVASIEKAAGFSPALEPRAGAFLFSAWEEVRQCFARGQ